MNGTKVPLVRAIRGPITLITVGVLFALNNFTPYRFEQTWPVMLIVFGLLSLLRRGTQPAWDAGTGTGTGQPYPQGAPPYTYPPVTAGGTYRQSQYPAKDVSQSGPVKGGFGSSAAPRANEPGPTTPPGGNV